MRISEREMRRLMKRMKMEELKDVEEVVIRLRDREIVVEEPTVMKKNLMGRLMYQIEGNERERLKKEGEIEIFEDDIKLVVEQTGASEEEAKKALIESKGDLAEAIMRLQST